MPADAWLLLVVSVGLGLGLELLYMRARLRGGRDRRWVNEAAEPGAGGSEAGGGVQAVGGDDEADEMPDRDGHGGER